MSMTGLGVFEHFQHDRDVDPEEVARAVLHVIAAHVSVGEIEDITLLLPKELKELWD